MPARSNMVALKALQTDYVQRVGFASLRCTLGPGCPAEVQPFREDTPFNRLYERSMAGVWELFFDTPCPEVIAAPCCAQFAVSRDQIMMRPLEDYVLYRQWLMETDLDDDNSGRIFEYLWHIIFGREPVQMEAQVDRLVKKTWDKYKQLPRSQRLLIGVSGIPGSGKTTLAAKVVYRINEMYRAELPGASAGEPPIAAFIPMDGYHLSRAQLDAMPDPYTAHARRGAHFTFDGDSFLALVKELRKPLAPESHTLYAPSFDHAVKDPVADDISIAPTTRIVVFEGNYLTLDRDPWRQAAQLMDERWFVEVDFDTARKRLVGRHVKAGIAKDEEDAHKRITENDLVNGQQIVEERVNVDEILTSTEDETWKPEAQGVGY
ncbi:hypothetical protein SLS57_000727 [Botryosphaeria dothidea]